MAPAEAAAVRTPVASRRTRPGSDRKVSATDWAEKRKAKIQAAKEKRDAGHFDRLDKVTEDHTFEPQRIAKAPGKSAARRRSSFNDDFGSPLREYRDNTTRVQSPGTGRPSIVRRQSSDRDSASGAFVGHEKGIRTPRNASESPAPSAVFVPVSPASPQISASESQNFDETLLMGSSFEVDVTFADASHAASFSGGGPASPSRVRTPRSMTGNGHYTATSEVLREFASILFARFPDLESAWSAFDLESTGTISAHDFQAGAEAIKFAGNSLSVFHSLDRNQNAWLTRHEFGALVQWSPSAWKQAGASYSTTADSGLGAMHNSSGPSLASTYANGERDEPMVSTSMLIENLQYEDEALETVELPLLGTSLLEDCDVSLSSAPVARAASGAGSASSSSAVGRPGAGLPATSVLVSAPEREDAPPNGNSVEQNADLHIMTKTAVNLRAGLERRGPHQWEDRDSFGDAFAAECVVQTVESLREEQPNRMPETKRCLTPPMASFSWWDVAADAEEPMAPAAAASGLPRGGPNGGLGGNMSLTMGVLRQQEAVLEVMRLASQHATAGAELTVNDLQVFLRGTPYEDFLLWFAHHAGSATVELDELSAALANFYLRSENEPAVGPNGDATAAAVSAALSAANASSPSQRSASPHAVSNGETATRSINDEGSTLSMVAALQMMGGHPQVVVEEPDAAAAVVATVPWREAPLRREEVKDVEPTGAPSELQGLAIATPPSGGATPQVAMERLTPRGVASERRGPAAGFTIIGPQEPLEVPQISTPRSLSPKSPTNAEVAAEDGAADAHWTSTSPNASQDQEAAVVAAGNTATAMHSVLQEVDDFSNRIVVARELEEQKHRNHRARVELLERKCQELEVQLGAAKQTEVALRQELLNAQYAEEEAPMVQEVKAQERTDFRYWRSPASRTYALAREVSAHTAAHDAAGLPGLPGSNSLMAANRAALGLGPSFMLSPVAEEPREDLLSLQEASPEASMMSMLQSSGGESQNSHVIVDAFRGELLVRVVSAYNLPNVDSGIIGDVSDPFVSVHIGSEERRTKVVYNNLNPVWDEESFSFSVDTSTPESRTLMFEVLDHSNFHAPRTLGTLAMDVCELPRAQAQRRREVLQDGLGGELEFELLLKPEAEQLGASPRQFGTSSPVQYGSVASPSTQQESPVSTQSQFDYGARSSEDANERTPGSADGVRVMLDETLALGREQLQHLEGSEGSQLQSDDESEMQKLIQMVSRLRSAGDVLPKAEIESLNTLVSRLSQLMERRRPTVRRVKEAHPSPWQSPTSSLDLTEPSSRLAHIPLPTTQVAVSSTRELPPLSASVSQQSTRPAGVPVLALAPLARCSPAIQPDARQQELPSPRDVPMLR